jgi:hypothetical protein
LPSPITTTASTAAATKKPKIKDLADGVLELMATSMNAFLQTDADDGEEKDPPPGAATVVAVVVAEDCVLECPY